MTTESETKRAAPGGNRTGRRRSFGNIRRLPSQRYQASYLAPDGSGRVNAPTTFQTKGDAAKWLSMQSAAITEHRWKPAAPKQATRTAFSTYADAWLERRELKPRTREEYRKLLATIKETFGGIALADIDAAMVRDWHEKLGPERPTHRAHLYALLRTILGTALEEDLILANPCHIRGAGKAKRVRTIRPATLEELATITTTMPERWHVLVLLAAWAALRFGELTELRRKDVVIRESKTATIRVRRGVTWVDKKPIIGEPKSEAGQRDVSLPPHLVPALEHHLKHHAQKGREGLLFPSVGGDQHLNHGTFYKHFKLARQAAGREDLRLHDLRHTGAVMAAQAGATTRELMDRLGHATASMSMRYQHVAEGRQDEIARRLSAMANGE